MQNPGTGQLAISGYGAFTYTRWAREEKPAPLEIDAARVNNRTSIKQPEIIDEEGINRVT
ncbi:MAG TPA: hypothetical protein DC042_10215 [Bacteroidales bacterium]|nr:hypothetical protein [Bacteroidales bacterium]